MIPIPKVQAPPRIQRLSVRNWLSGYNSQLDEGRTPNEGLRVASNVILDQDGTVRPRPSLIRYGTQPVGTVLGEIYEFVKMNGTTPENWLATVQVVEGEAKVYVNKDGEAWQVCEGKTYDTSTPVHFCQIDDKVLVMNGVDNLSYIRISDLVVIPFTALTTPTAPSLTVGTQLVGTTYPVRYKITASNAGETAASVAGTGTVSKPRDVWQGTSSGATEYVDISFPRVTGAQRYNIYYGDTAGNEVFIDTIADPGTGTNATYRDTGASARDLNREAPLGDTTAGPKVTRGTVINGQIFLTGDTDNPRYVRFGGTGEQVFDFSPYGGGGWVEIGRGTKEFPVVVKSFRDGKGNPTITVLCRGTNGSGKRYTMTPQTQTVGDTIISYFQVLEDNGQDGTDSPDGVILSKDSLWYPSRDGFKTTGTKPQLQNILSTNTVSETIQNDIQSLNVRSMDKCVGIANEGRLYWALPVGAEENNQIWVLDLVRKGAWVLPFNIPASWMVLYGDNTGRTHHLVLSNNVIYELSYAQDTTDDLVPFPTSIASGQLRFSEDGMEWARVIDVTFIVLRPSGMINVSVGGKTEESTTNLAGSDAFTKTTSIAGWSESGWGTFGWSNTQVVPVSYSNSREQIVIEVDEDMNWVTWALNSSGASSYQLSDVIVRYVNIGVIDVS